MFFVDKYVWYKVIGEFEICLGDIDLCMFIKMWLNLRDIDEVRLIYWSFFFWIFWICLFYVKCYILVYWEMNMKFLII